jgi:valyl-tRNA synthetase
MGSRGQTTLSDEKVLKKDKANYIIQYKIEGSEDFLTIATTRLKLF